MFDSILYWNDVALEANRVSHTNGKLEQTGPTLSSRALAIVHLAMYEAYAAINPEAGRPYSPDVPECPLGCSAQAAAAGAAHATLSALFPSQKYFFDVKLAEAGDILNPGHDFGREVARWILRDRAADPGAGDSGYVPSYARGRHQVDPDNPEQGFHGPFYGTAKPFAISYDRWIDPPPYWIDPPPFDDGSNPDYVWALRQVRGLGIKPELMGTLPYGYQKRTNDQTLIGLFWAYDGAAGIGTPPRLYNQIVRKIAMARENTEADNALLFALINVAMADAGILAWRAKYWYDFWRPVVGIKKHDPSTGLASQAANDLWNETDIDWLPLGAPATNAKNPYIVPQPSGRKNFTPNFPSYPSGHATFGAAALHMTRLFYGVACNDRSPDNLLEDVAFVSDELNGVNQDNDGTVRPRHLRNFPDGLWRMIIENARSRVYLGIHWIFDAFAVDEKDEPDLVRNIGGVPLGLAIAEDIFKYVAQSSELSRPWRSTLIPKREYPKRDDAYPGVAGSRTRDDAK